MEDFTNNGIFETAQTDFFAEQNEKRAVRRISWAIAVPGVIFFLVTRYWGKIILSVAGRLGIENERVMAFLRDPGVLQLLQIGLSFLLMTAPFILCAKIAGARVGKIAALKKPESGSNLAYFFFGLGFCSFANIAVNTAGRLFKEFGVYYTMPKSEDPEGAFGVLLVIFSTVIVPAVLEEFAFRGIVFGLLLPYGEGFAILATATVFGLFHGNFEQIPFAFLVGLVLGFVRVKTGSIALCMAIHAANNLVAMSTSYSSALPTAVSSLLYTAYVMAALTLSVLGVAFLRGRNDFVFSPAKTALSAKKVSAAFFASPAFIIYAALFLFRAVRYITG